MTPASSDGDIREIVRRAARTALQTSGEIIVDRTRISELADEITKRRRERTAGAGSVKDIPETSRGETVTTTPTAPGTEITGIQIGSVQVAECSGLEERYAETCECQKCPLGATRTKFVYGVGSPSADLMFVGEAPGKNEDLQGEPFVGRAGQLLDRILAAINLSRPEIYIANILKCRPPGNRDPQPAEMEQCFPYLKEQIALIRPKLLCSLGRISAQALLQTTTPLGKLRGQWHSYQGIPLRVTYHPAALLRNPNFKRGCWEDMQIIQAEYERLTA